MARVRALKLSCASGVGCKLYVFADAVLSASFAWSLCLSMAESFGALE